MIDVAVGFFLYFVTAIDYALIVGRMQNANPGFKQRFVMNVFTCLGCFVGVSLVLFLWGFAKEITLLVIPLLIFAGSVMIKLGYEGHEYFINSKVIPTFLRNTTILVLKLLYYLTKIFTFWMPELSSPSVKKMSLKNLAKWSFLLPFIIGVDDLIGYMGAMTIYNAYGLLFGIYLADIVIDLLIFISPKFTKKMVENAVLSLLATYAFIYLAYKSFSESYLLLVDKVHLSNHTIVIMSVTFVLLVLGADFGKYLFGKNRLDHVRGR